MSLRLVTPAIVLIPQDPAVLTNSTLHHLPAAGTDLFLSVTEPHNPQPDLYDEESHYLYGPSGQQGGMKRDASGRGVVDEDIYGFWVDRGRGVVVSGGHSDHDEAEENRIFGTGRERLVGCLSCSS
jgi:hypothetical protein